MLTQQNIPAGASFIFVLALLILAMFTKPGNSLKTPDLPDESELISEDTLDDPVMIVEQGMRIIVENLSETYHLTKREADVAMLLLDGYSRPAIAEELFISLGTVNSHVSSIYKKTGVNSQQELLSLAKNRNND